MALDQMNAPGGYQDLSQMWASPNSMWGPIMAAQDQNDRVAQNNQINQNLANQLYQQNDVMNPLAAEHQRQLNDYYSSMTAENKARTPGTMADSQVKQINAEIEKQLKDSTVQTRLADNMSKMSDDQFKQTMNGLHDSMINGQSPHLRTWASTVLNNMPEYVQKRWETLTKTQSDQEISAAGNASRESINQAQLDAGKYRDKRVTDINMKLSLEGDPVKKYTLAYGAAQEAAQSGDQESAQYFGQLANQLKPIAERALAAGRGTPQAGTPDISALAGVPTNSTPGLPNSNAVTSPVEAPTQQYKTGESYTGKTGTYRYKGGNPKDKNNWEKVK